MCASSRGLQSRMREQAPPRATARRLCASPSACNSSRRMRFHVRSLSAAEHCRKRPCASAIEAQWSGMKRRKTNAMARRTMARICCTQCARRSCPMPASVSSSTARLQRSYTQLSPAPPSKRAVEIRQPLSHRVQGPRGHDRHGGTPRLTTYHVEIFPGNIQGRRTGRFLRMQGTWAERKVLGPGWRITTHVTDSAS